MNKLLLIITLIAIPVSAKAACYSPAEIEAEQGIRIHSELMIIGLNCQHMGKRAGQNLYGQYRSFTARHADLFASYEQSLMNFYTQQGKNPESSLNALRTKYANQISDDVAQMRPDVFCSRYAPRITQASQMRRDDVRKWAATVYDSHPVSHPQCRG